MDKKIKVALVHDYLKEYGGAERVLESLHQLFPEAPLYTSYYDPSSLGIHRAKFQDWDIRSSWIQRVPYAGKLLSPLRVFAPLIFERFNLSSYDLVISSSGAYFAKSVITKPSTLHLAYIHTPPRFLYGFTTGFDYQKNLITKIIGSIVNHFLRIYDFEVSQRPDILVANSKNVQSRIKKFYRRSSVVIYPPVDLPEFKNLKVEKGEYFLALNRLVRGKGTEIIVEAATNLNLPLKVVGVGPELERLKELAGKNVQFLGGVSDLERVKLYAGAKALIVASGDEDFGITPVEAAAAGTPVIAVRAGGFLETIIDGKTGQFFDKADVESLEAVLKNFDPKKFKAEDCQKQAEKFSTKRFKKEILELVSKNI